MREDLKELAIEIVNDQQDLGGMFEIFFECIEADFTAIRLIRDIANLVKPRM
jgi:hypothetical protein